MLSSWIVILTNLELSVVEDKVRRSTMPARRNI